MALSGMERSETIFDFQWAAGGEPKIGLIGYYPT